MGGAVRVCGVGRAVRGCGVGGAMLAVRGCVVKGDQQFREMIQRMYFYHHSPSYGRIIGVMEMINKKEGVFTAEGGWCQPRPQWGIS